MKCFFVCLFTVVVSTVSAEGLTLSVDLLTFVSMILPNPSEKNGAPPPSQDLSSLWICVDLSGTTDAGRELGFGFFLRADRVALRSQYRFFSNPDSQSGFFWGLFGYVEWRKLHWGYDDNNELAVGWSYPFDGDNVFHSVGLAAGVDAGFRIRIGSIGITPFIGVGLPLFYCFGTLPPDNDRTVFWIQNAVIRAVDIGLRIDFFL
jgi:hypothetical protein